MLKEAFQEYGQVRSVRIIKDKFTGEPRGFAFVEMPVDEEAQAAISKMNGQELEGKRLTVNEARERDARPSNRSGGNGMGSRRGGFGNSRPKRF